MKVRQFATVEEAVAVLGHHKIADRLLALEEIGINLNHYTHAELAAAVHGTREKVCKSMGVLGRTRTRRAA